MYVFFFFSRFGCDANRTWDSGTDGKRNFGIVAAEGRAVAERFSLAIGARHWCVEAIRAGSEGPSYRMLALGAREKKSS